MSAITQLITNYHFTAFIAAWLISAFLKAIIIGIKEKKFSVKKGFVNGGMPSSHSAVVAAITTSVYMVQGFSELFFVALAFSLIIISDAFGVRRNVGLQGDTLNKLLKELKKNPVKIVHGHSFFQVTIGIIIGIMVAATMFYAYF